MNIFNLPDLGEGLPDAEIHEWFVKEGETVKLDQPLVSMETAKAVVDVPSPQDGTILKCYGKIGDIIKTGAPLVSFVENKSNSSDKGTVVGKLEESTEKHEDRFSIGGSSNSQRPKATPPARLIAHKLGINLSTIKPSGDYGVITQQDVEQVANQQSKIPEGFEPLHGVRRAMLSSMQLSHLEVVPVTIFDEADIESWSEDEDITVRLIRAIVQAVKVEPALNAWFDTKHSARKLFKEVNLGLAMDNEDGLFVPVIPNVESFSDKDLRNHINNLKQSVQNRTVPSEAFKGTTFTLSNFGKFAGRFASPIIVPPTVAILAVGRLYHGAVYVKKELKAHRLLPLSLTFDHRAITGGEATRFLGSVMEALSSSS